MSRISSIGQHIRNILYLPEQTPYKRYPNYSGYEMWEIYNKKQKDAEHKGIKYHNFLKYIYILKRLDLIEEIKKTKKSRVPKPGEDHPSNFIPEEWERNYYKINKKLKDSPMWNNPKFEYYSSIGSIIYVEGKPVTKKQLERIEHPKKEKVSKAPLYPSYIKTTHIRISKELKDMIDVKKGDRSIEEFLRSLVTSV